jgi:hypothetical protein
MLAAAWALAIAVFLMPRHAWLPRVAAVLAVVAIVPWIGGVGIAGWNLVVTRAPQAATERATLAVGANSAFSGPKPTAPSGAAASPGPSEATKASVAAGTESTVRTSLSHLPVGLVDVSLRPFPWQPTVGLTLLMARIETLGWYLLYALTLLGIVVSLRRRQARLALQFPVLLLGMIVGIAALTQGNLGTAFRHRDQILWILALCSMAGVQWLVLESRWARRPRAVPATPDAPRHAAPSEAGQVPVLSTPERGR